MNTPTNVCPKCQQDLTKAIASGAITCPGCGQVIDGSAERTSAPPQTNTSNAGRREQTLSKLQLLQLLLVVDAAVLALLGMLLILAPKQVELAFKFKDLPDGVSYVIGMWGCVLVTMAAGYAVAATNPIRHVIWVQVGIARGVLECALGAVYLARGIVTFQQVGFGIVLAGLISIAYILCYPRQQAAHTL